MDKETHYQLDRIEEKIDYLLNLLFAKEEGNKKEDEKV